MRRGVPFHMEENFKKILQAQIALYQQLLDLSKRQTEALVKNDVLKVQDITGEIEVAMRQITILERKRQGLTETLIKRYGLQQNVSFVAFIQSANLKTTDFLLQLIQNLDEVIRKLKIYVQKNKALVDIALDYVSFNINIMASTAASVTYAPQGHEGVSVSKNKIFDQSI